jgi:hypothetical protein
VKAADEPCRFQPVEPGPTRCGRDIDNFGKLRLAQLSMLLKGAENANIRRIEAGSFHVFKASFLCPYDQGAPISVRMFPEY